MITKTQFEKLRNNYGVYASFAVWDSWENVSDFSMFSNDEILDKLNNDYVFVALNPAKRPESINQDMTTFENFHSGYSYQKDYKLCYALRGTKFWGSYITDLYKSFRECYSPNLKQMLKNEPANAENDKRMLKEEIRILTENKGKKDVVLLALGRETEKYLKKMFKIGKGKYEYRIVYIEHYSNYCSKETYRENFITTVEREKL